jgi:very-short-patch-repair endonuclease/predicted transcriptional regulator of viral defense system
MTTRKLQSTRAWALAGSQHDVISSEQLLQLGFTPAAIKHRVARGRLHPKWRGVYAVGRRQLSREGIWMAAVLACGPHAALSHLSAATLWGIRPSEPSRVDISVPVSVLRRRPGIHLHRRTLQEEDFTTCRRIPVTTPVCTLIDIAALLSWEATERAVNQADQLDLVDPVTLRSALDAVAPRPGLAPLRKILDYRTFTVTDTENEQRFLPIARRAGLPLPLTQEWVNGFRVDFYWPDLGLVVETDGLRYHRTPAEQAADRLRDQTHSAAGLTCLRFTRAQVRFEPAHVRSVLTAVADRLADRRSSDGR